jgi:DNA-binding FrmR family transcriptional regulator
MSNLDVKLTRELQKRLRFIEGQARGIQKMINENREPDDIRTQLLAMQAATGSAADLITRHTMLQRIEEAINRAVLNCVGQCEFCDDLDGLDKALEEVDYSALLDELAKQWSKAVKRRVPA